MCHPRISRNPGGIRRLDYCLRRPRMAAAGSVVAARRHKGTGLLLSQQGHLHSAKMLKCYEFRNSLFRTSEVETTEYPGNSGLPVAPVAQRIEQRISNP